MAQRSVTPTAGPALRAAGHQATAARRPHRPASPARPTGRPGGEDLAVGPSAGPEGPGAPGTARPGDGDAQEAGGGTDGAVAAALLRAARALVGIARQTVGEVSVDLTMAQHRALVVLHHDGPRRLADLAKALSVSPSTATRMCDRLERKGLITRRRDDLDKREVDLTVTPEGLHCVESVAARRRAAAAALVGRLPGEARQGLVEALQNLDLEGDVPETDWSVGWES